MNNNLTELVFLLDRSGSMHGMEADTIGGFNAMLEKQKKLAGRAYVTTILFDHRSVVLHDRVDLRDVAPMTEQDYLPRGSTALLDAIGGAIHHIAGIHKYARPQDVPGHTVFVIITDGKENASHRYPAARVKQMLEREKEQYGWEFLFLGANIDAVETAEQFGIDQSRAVTYRGDRQGTRLNYEVVHDAVACVRASEELPRQWKSRIEQTLRDRR